MNPLDLIILALACWRLSNLISNEKGPFHCFQHIQQVAKRLHRRHKWLRFYDLRTLTTCEYCNSIYICAFALIAYLKFQHAAILVALPFAGSTAVIFIKRLHEGLSRQA